jgi:hypothetical protein
MRNCSRSHDSFRPAAAAILLALFLIVGFCIAEASDHDAGHHSIARDLCLGFAVTPPGAAPSPAGLVPGHWTVPARAGLLESVTPRLLDPPPKSLAP